MEAAPRFELGVKDLQSSALPLGYAAIKKWSGWRDSNSRPSPWQGDALPLSHIRTLWWFRTESNRRHVDFQSTALPTELLNLNMAEPTGFEPAISCVTGRHVRPLHHGSAWWTMTGSNRRPSACKADALPAELIVHASLIFNDKFYNNIYKNYSQEIFIRRYIS